MRTSTFKGSNGLIIAGFLIHLIIFSYLLYPLVIGNPSWSDKIVITNSGFESELIYDESAGEFVFWVENYLSSDRVVKVGRLNNNRLIEEKVIFKGNERVPISNITVACDNIGNAYVLITGLWDLDQFLIIELESLSLKKYMNAFSMEFRIAQLISGNGNVYAISTEKNVFSINPDGYTKRIDIQFGGKIEYLKFINNREPEFLVITQEKLPINETAFNVEYYLKRYDTKGELKGQVELDFKKISEFGFEVISFDDDPLFVYLDSDEHGYSKYRYMRLNKTLAKTGFGVLEDTEFLIPEDIEFDEHSDLFCGKWMGNKLVFVYVSPEDGIVINYYNKNLAKTDTERLILEFPEKICVKIKIFDLDNIDIFYFANPIWEHSRSIFEGTVYYVSLISSPGQPDNNFNLLIYFIGIISCYLLIVFIYIYSIKLRRNRALAFLNLNVNSEVLKRTYKVSIDELRQKFLRAKQENKRGNIVFGKLKRDFINFYTGIIIIIFSILSWLFLFLWILINFGPGDNLVIVVFLIILPVIPILLGFGIGIIVSFEIFILPKIYENGLEIDLRGLPIPKDKMFFWFVDLDSISFDTSEFQVIPSLNTDFQVKLIFNSPLNATKKHSLSINIYNYLKIEPYLKKIFGNNLFDLYRFKVSPEPRASSDITGISSYSNMGKGSGISTGPITSHGSKTVAWNTLEKKLKKYSPFFSGLVLLGFLFIFFISIMIMSPDISKIHEIIHLRDLNSFLFLFSIGAISIIIIFIQINLYQKRRSIKKRIIELELSGQAAPESIKRYFRWYPEKRYFFDLKKDLHFKYYFSNLYKLKKRNIAVILVLILFISSLWLFFIEPPGHKYYSDADIQFIKLEIPYGIPTSNQFFMLNDTIIQNEDIQLIDNITVINGATLTMRNVNLTFNEKLNRYKDFSSYYNSYSNLRIFVSEDSTIILDNCSLKGLYIIDIEGTVIGINCIFDNLEKGIHIDDGTCRLNNCKFTICDYCINLDNADCELIGIQTTGIDYPIKTDDSKILIQDSSFESEIHHDDYYGYYNSGTGIRVHYDYYKNKFENKGIIIENTNFLGFSNAIEFDQDSIPEEMQVRVSKNRIQNCTIGIQLNDESVTFNDNLFVNCSNAFKIETDYNYQLLLEQNSFIDNEIKINLIGRRKIFCYNWKKNNNYPSPSIEVYNEQNERINILATNKDLRDDHVEFNLKLSVINIYQNDSIYQPFPANIYVYSNYQGIAHGILGPEDNELNISFKELHDLKVNNFNLLDNLNNEPMIELRFTCLGSNLSNVTVTATFNEIFIANWEYNNCLPNNNYYAYLNITQFLNGTTFGNLRFNLTSKKQFQDIFPYNNEFSKKILVINGELKDVGLLRTNDVVIFNSGNTTIENKNFTIPLDSPDYFDEYSKMSWFIGKNGSLNIKDSTFEIDDTNNKYSYYYSYWLKLYCNGRLILKNSNIFEYSYLQCFKSRVEISDSKLYNMRLSLKMSNISLINTSFTNEYLWDSFFIYDRCNLTIENSDFNNIVILGDGYYYYYYGFYSNVNLFNQSYEIIVSDSFFNNTYTGFGLANCTINNCVINGSIVYLGENTLKVSNSEFIQTTISIYYGYDDSLLNNESCVLSNTVIKDDSSLELKNGNNFRLESLIFSNCTNPFYVENASIKYSNLKFYDNRLDLNLTCKNALDSFSNLSGLKVQLNYILYINLRSLNNTPVSQLYETYYLFLYFKTILNETIDYDYITNDDQYIFPWYTLDKNGTINYMEPKLIDIQIRDRRHDEMIEWRQWLIDTKDVKYEFIIDFFI